MVNTGLLAAWAGQAKTRQDRLEVAVCFQSRPMGFDLKYREGLELLPVVVALGVRRSGSRPERCANSVAPVLFAKAPAARSVVLAGQSCQLFSQCDQPRTPEIPKQKTEQNFLEI